MIIWVTLENMSYATLVYKAGIEHIAYITYTNNKSDCIFNVWDIQSKLTGSIDDTCRVHCVLPRQTVLYVANKILDEAGFIGKHDKPTLVRMIYRLSGVRP